ncbi:MAG: ATP-binding protein [Candidatus Binatia bacterium]
MRLVVKLTAAMMLGICLVLAVHAWLRIAREARLIEADIERSHALLGGALAPALAEAWRRDGEAGLAALLDQAATTDGPTLRWQAQAAAPAGSRIQGTGAARHFVTLVPLPPGGPGGAIEISEPLQRETDYLRTTLASEAATAAALAVVSAIIALAAGAWLVGRPTRRLIDHARRLGQGDFSAPLCVTQRDEIGDLAAALAAAAARLAEATARATRETAQRLAALEQLRHADRLATVGTLAAGVAHELGTPLTVVAELGRQVERGDTTPAEAREHGEVIVEQARRMTAIVRQLLDFARCRPAQRTAHDPRTLVSSTLALLTPLAVKRRVELRWQAAPDIPDAALDAVQIQQALTNLVVNGIQAMPAGGTLAVAVDVADAAPPAGGPARRCLRIAVRDDGSGIEPEHLPRIFEPFFTTKPVGDGTGLGLAVAYGIAREHGGWIDVASTPGHGSCFAIHLPTAPAPPLAASA